jgi:hypothetical protein
MGRFYAGIGEFIRAIKYWEECITEASFDENHKLITKKAAYNLQYLHQKMGNKQIAAAIIRNYLS